MVVAEIRIGRIEPIVCGAHGLPCIVHFAVDNTAANAVPVLDRQLIALVGVFPSPQIVHPEDAVRVGAPLAAIVHTVAVAGERAVADRRPALWEYGEGTVAGTVAQE